MGISDAGLQIHGGVSGTEPVAGATIGTSSYNPDVSAYSLDFGAQGAAPSITSDIIGTTYPSAPSMPRGGESFGLHVVITVAFVTADSGSFPVTISIATSDTKDDTTTYKVLGAGIFTLAEFEVVGAHYFIPMASRAFKRYLYALWKAGATVAATGKVFMYFGPGPAGAD